MGRPTAHSLGTEEIGIDPYGWSKKRITKSPSRLHRAKALSTYTKARRENPALISAAKAYFGSWGKALYSTGIDPNLYFVHQRWREPKASDKR